MPSDGHIRLNRVGADQVIRAARGVRVQDLAKFNLQPLCTTPFAGLYAQHFVQQITETLEEAHRHRSGRSLTGLRSEADVHSGDYMRCTRPEHCGFLTIVPSCSNPTKISRREKQCITTGHLAPERTLQHTAMNQQERWCE